MKKNILLLIIISFIFSCKNNTKIKDNEFQIKARINGCDACMLYLEEVGIGKSVLIDSNKANSQGEVSFVSKISIAGLYDLKLNKNNFIRLLIDKGEIIELTANAKQMSKNYEVKGSAGSLLLKNLYDKYFSSLAVIDSLTALYNKNKLSPDFLKIKNSIDSSYKFLIIDYKNFIRKFVSDNDASLSSLIAIYQKLGSINILNLADTNDFKYFEKLDKSLISKYPDNIHAIEFHKKITELKRSIIEDKIARGQLQTGSIPPDINFPLPDGQTVSLHSLKSKPVLIYFWASWSKACITENANLIKLYNKYKNKGFEVYSVSLDRDKLLWEKAIKDQQLNWINVCDFKYWSSPVVKLYAIEAVPFTYLLGKDGKIINKGIFGNELAKNIDRALKN